MRRRTSMHPRRLLAAGTIAAAALCLAVPQGFAAGQSTTPSTGAQESPSSTMPQKGPSAMPDTGRQTQSTAPAQPSFSRDELVGKELRSANGESFGEIEDVVEEQGSIKAALIDVGGFLGLGAKRVAIPVDQISPQGDHMLAKGLTKSEIENMPEHKMPDKGNMLTK